MTMTADQPKLRLAIVGAGRITRQSHLPAALGHPEVECCALVDSCEQRSLEVCRDLGVNIPIATQIEDVIEGLDAAVIATPNASHHQIAVACLSRGVHTLIEKPMAVGVEQGQAILLAAERSNAVVAVGYHMRFRQTVTLMKKLLSDGYFGTIHRFSYTFGTDGGWSPVSGYIMDRKSSGGGVLVVSGSHFINRMLYWFGYPSSIEYQDDSQGGPEANALIDVEFSKTEKPIRGRIRLSKTVELPAGFVMETDRGIVVLHDHKDAQITIGESYDDGCRIQLTIKDGEMPQGDEYELQMNDFVEACQQGRNPRVGGSEGLESDRFFQQCYANRMAREMNPFASTAGDAK